ncbi:CPBP family intramembrane glutamic endopeptidase [Clostridium pasteurianum]|uniref:CAAX amino terminal protease family n=1 Tax=Clostridium pasteurianum BC1 TaxID=86416 RepID=R4JYY4_CLOPA|nr:CPBP family intramembrane glutamic endopeptidase [Clostridium pasteurianum]AGK96012.1 CAAX amino terminal protease family [Clostridium pasteurianum BC1]
MNSINNLIFTIIYYLFMFILPIYFYLKFKNKVSPFSYLKLNNKPLKGIVIGLLISLIYLLLLIIRNYIYGWKPINLNIGVLWINILLVGIFEEVPFRGFVLQKLQDRTSFLTANIMTTLLFVFMHYPLWILTGIDILQSSISIAFISFIFGYVYKEFNSLWVPIICHSIFNMSTWIGLK